MTLSFKPNKENKKFLDGISNKNAFFNDIIELIRSDKIKLELNHTQHKTEISVITSKEEQEKKELELKHLGEKIKLTSQRVLESHAKTRFLNIQSDFIESQGRPLSNSGKMLIAKSIKSQNNTSGITCPECAEVFDYCDSRTLATAKENIIDHYSNTHKKFFTDHEIREIREISV